MCPEKMTNIYIFNVRLKNESNKLSRFTHLLLKNAITKEEINPVFWSDNFITLFT